MAETSADMADFACRAEVTCLFNQRGTERTMTRQTEERGSSAQGGATSTTRRQVIAGMAMTVAGLAATPLEAFSIADDEITRANAAIHHRRAFSASPTRVYEALTDAGQFHKVTMLSDAMKGGMPAGAKT
jgi:hypothetical protein